MKAQPDPSRAWITEQAAEWFVENRSGPLSGARRRQFTRWLRASPLHIMEYLAIARCAADVAVVAKGVDTTIPGLLAEAGGEDTIVPLRAWEEATRDPHPVSNRSLLGFAKWRSSVRLTVAIAACLVLAITGWLWVRHPLPAIHPGDREYVASRDQGRTVKLADDTVVYLTANSAVRVRFDAQRRQVHVERGQALFEVAHDVRRPFEVRAGNTVIEDVGTVFNVSREAQQTVVTVLEGQVAVWGIPQSSGQLLGEAAAEGSSSTPMPPRRTDLVAGEQASVLPTGAVRTRRPADLAQAAPWLKPQIVFDGETLAEVAAEFNRHNREQIEIADPRIGALPVSGVFHSYDVASFEGFLNSLPGVQATVINGRVRVSASP